MKIYDDKYIILTGGAGFIGSCLLHELNRQGIYNVIVVDDLGKKEKWKNLVGKRFWDCIHKDQLFQWLEKKESDIEAFIHLGACSSTTEVDANYLLENNYRYSQRLVEYALTYDHRFIYASSAATYGDGSLGFSDQHEDLGQYAPLNMYGYSKHLFDLWLKDQNLLDKVTGLKYFNIFGPNELHKEKMASAILKMVKDSLEKGKIFLFQSSEPKKFSDGEQCRDFLYVKDAVKMTLQFLMNDKMGIYNVGSGEGHSWNALAHAVIQALEKDVSIEYIPMPRELEGRYQNYTCADMKKSKKHNLLVPEFSLEKGVHDYICHYLLPKKYL